MDRNDKAIKLIAESNALPGVLRSVTISLLMYGKSDEALTYLLGASDVLAGLGHARYTDVAVTRERVRDIIRGGDNVAATTN